jgi:integrase
MARRRKGPWQRNQDGCWYTTVGRKVVRLGSVDDPWDAIEDAYHREHAKGSKPAQLTVAWLCDQFLDYAKLHRADGTYHWYKFYLDEFFAAVGPKLLVDQLTPRRVNDWIQSRFGRHSDTVQHHAARCVVRAMNWAVKERLIDRSPLIGLVKPSPTNRETAITPAQFKTCLEHAKGPFRDVLLMLWHTGCRPQELRLIEARWVDGNKIVLPALKSKGKKRRRVIYLNPTAAGIVQRLSAANPTGPIFRNQLGNPWTKDAINCGFVRLRSKTGIDGLCAYALRHGFATEALKSGVDTTTVGVLMGHSNPAMVARVYQHLAQDDDYMLGVVTRLNAGNGAAIGNPQAAAG